MPQKVKPKKAQRPAQHQDRQPGLESEMKPRPQADDPSYRGSNKLRGKVALITGGDSGIGRAVAVAFAKEGAQVVVVYLDEHKDAEETRTLVEGYGQTCLLMPGDVRGEKFCQRAIQQTIQELKRLDIVVNNAAVQYPQDSLEDISSGQLEKTFRTNIFSFFTWPKPPYRIW